MEDPRSIDDCGRARCYHWGETSNGSFARSPSSSQKRRGPQAVRRSIGPPRQWTRPPMTNGVRTQGTREETIEGGHTNFPVP